MTFLDLLGLNPLRPPVAYEADDLSRGNIGSVAPTPSMEPAPTPAQAYDSYTHDELVYENAAAAAAEAEAAAAGAADANAPATGTPVPPPEFNYVPSPGVAQFYNPKSQPGPGYGGKGGGMPQRPIYQPGPSPMPQPQFYPSQAAAMRSSPFGFSQSRSMGQPGFGSMGRQPGFGSMGQPDFGRLGAALGNAFAPGGVGSVGADTTPGLNPQGGMPERTPQQNVQLQAQQRFMSRPGPGYGGKGGGMPQRPIYQPGPGGKGGGMSQRPMPRPSPSYGGKGGGMSQRPMRQSGFGGKGGFS